MTPSVDTSCGWNGVAGLFCFESNRRFANSRFTYVAHEENIESLFFYHDVPRSEFAKAPKKVVVTIAPAFVMSHPPPPVSKQPARLSRAPVILAADSLDLVKLLVEVAQSRHRALGDEEHSGLRVSLLQKNLHAMRQQKNNGKHDTTAVVGKKRRV